MVAGGATAVGCDDPFGFRIGGYLDGNDLSSLIVSRLTPLAAQPVLQTTGVLAGLLPGLLLRIIKGTTEEDTHIGIGRVSVNTWRITGMAGLGLINLSTGGMTGGNSGHRS
jgi:hypothetical protein